MKNVGEPAVLHSLIARLARLRPDSARRWGSLTPHEMLCHLGDAAEMVLRTRPRTDSVPHPRRPIVKLLALWSPVRWPHGWATNPMHDPRMLGTPPTEFAIDLARAVAGLNQIATGTGLMEPAHGVLGMMSREDWQRWAYQHTDHHLRQFGL